MQPRKDTPFALRAFKQHGHLTVRDFEDLGVPRGVVRARVLQGRLLPVHRGVWALGHRPRSREARWMAAVLACGPDTLLSRRSAGALHGFTADRLSGVDVVTSRHVRSSPRIHVHRTRSLPHQHRMVRDDIPVTTPFRTLLDLSYVLGPEELVTAAMEAEFRRMVRLEWFLDPGATNGRGGPALRHLVEHVRRGTRSELEGMFFELCESAGLPRPRTNHRIGRWKADFAWPHQRVVVETDGYASHRGRAAFERDRARIADFMAKGWDVLPTTWNHVRFRPALVLRVLVPRLTA